MELRFYGVRGSCPTPISKEEYREKVVQILHSTKEILQENGSHLTEDEIYKLLPTHLQRNIGGNTTCLCLESKSGERFIFDMGTGLRTLGNELAPIAFGSDQLNLNIFMTHTHWDHIQGWPFFKPAYSPNVNINFYSCIPDLEERLKRQQLTENFPVSLDQMPSQKSFHLLEENQKCQVGDFEIIPFPLKHPGSCTGYRISDGTNAVIFATDVEFREEELATIRRWQELYGEVSVLIIDAQYSTDEAEKKVGWGHTAVRMAVRSAVEMGVKAVVLTHFEPDHTDQVVIDIVNAEIQDYFHNIDVILAYEGLTLTVD
jgi:phosphoribosyl 1,2-cyclic phosphodiesterase